MAQDSIFAIGDIHGCNDELAVLLDKLPIKKDSTVVFLGDYIDRGGQSRQVIDTILELKKMCRVITLRGNHEQMLLDFLENPRSEKGGLFIYNGGAATLASYATEDGQYNIPDHHLDFYQSLPVYWENDDYFFVHAGVPDIDLSQIDAVNHGHTLLWVRTSFFISDHRWEKMIVHGHTPVDEVEVHPHRINVDTGCVYNGSLSAIRLPDGTTYSVSKQTKTVHTFLREANSRRIATRFEGTIPVTIERDGATHKFVTKNYNEFGLLIYSENGENPTVLEIKERIQGTLEPSNEKVSQFEGTVVRIENRNGNKHYGIQIHSLSSKP